MHQACHSLAFGRFKASKIMECRAFQSKTACKRASWRTGSAVGRTAPKTVTHMRPWPCGGGGRGKLRFTVVIMPQCISFITCKAFNEWVAGLRWTIPANIPVPAFGNSSLFGEFTKSIGENLAKFPQPPALQDKFWYSLPSFQAHSRYAQLWNEQNVAIHTIWLYAPQFWAPNALT